MPCYECSKDPKYACHNCGGLVCEDHGTRDSRVNKCWCNRCIPSVARNTVAQMVMHLETLQALLEKRELWSRETREKINRIHIDKLLTELGQ